MEKIGLNQKKVVGLQLLEHWRHWRQPKKASTNPEFPTFPIRLANTTSSNRLAKAEWGTSTLGDIRN